MPIGCKNCGAHFTQAEMERRRPPAYPWALTTVGARVAAENEANGGDTRQCPNCGQRTLR